MSHSFQELKNNYTLLGINNSELKTALEFCGMVAEQINNMQPEERETLINKVMEERPDLNNKNFAYDDNEYLKANNNIREILTNIDPSKVNDLMNNSEFQEYLKTKNYTLYESLTEHKN
jgi:tRNA splicing endonuclease